MSVDYNTFIENPKMFLTKYVENPKMFIIFTLKILSKIFTSFQKTSLPLHRKLKKNVINYGRNGTWIRK